ncbi:hypothetical protein TorRG33x02_342760, partial [Trema orientale]
MAQESSYYSKSGNVYSFRIVILEIICGRRNVICDLPEEEAVLEDWAYSCFDSNELQNWKGWWKWHFGASKKSLRC